MITDINMNMNLRRSAHREAILNFLSESDDHPTADHIYGEIRKKIPGISLGTVYRNLNLLGQQGKIRILQSESGPARYDYNTNPHYHFVCRKCGTVHDVFPPENPPATIPDSPDFMVEDIKIEYYGICTPCNQTKKE